MPKTEFHRIPGAAPKAATPTSESDVAPTREQALVLPSRDENAEGSSTWALRACDGNTRLSAMYQVLRELRTADADAEDAPDQH